MAANPHEVVRAWDRMWSAQANFRENWQLIAEFMAPHKSNIQVQRAPGTKQTQRLYDGTALDARQKCAATIHGAIAAPSQKWFSFKLRQDELNHDKAVKDWLEQADERVYLAKAQSNFTSVFADVIDDMVTFGPGVMFITKRARTRAGAFGGLVYRHIPIGTFVMDENDEGEIDVLYRRFTVSHRVAFSLWGDRIGTDALKILKDRPEEPMAVIHGVYPREIRRRTSDAAEDMAWASCYVTEQHHTLLDEGGFKQFPFAVARWTEQEIYGRSPGFNAYPDVRTLNALIQQNLEGLTKRVNPALWELQGAVFGELSLEPAARNIVTQRDAVGVIESGNRANEVIVEIQHLERKIREAFFNDQMQLKDGPQMTAEEVRARLDWMLRLLGPTGGRLQFSFLNRMLERDFSLMAEDGALPPMPDILREYAGQDAADLDVEYEGPLARAQRSRDLTAIETFYRMLAAVQEVTQSRDVADIADHDEALRVVADVTGVPGTVLADPRLVARVREARQLAQQQAQEAQLAMQAAESAGKAAPFLQEIRTAATPQPAGAAA